MNKRARFLSPLTEFIQIIIMGHLCRQYKKYKTTGEMQDLFKVEVK